MSAVITVIPIFIIRYTLLSMLNKEALRRAAFFAPLAGRERIAYWVYQITTLFIIIDLILLKIRTDSAWFHIGLIIYGLGLVLYAISVVNYAKPEANGINLKGLYRMSRNPMYIAYFICLSGCALMSYSWTLLALLIIFQISSHWIILSEERWCIEKFGEEYRRYMNKVRRYI
ncbi:MAG: isoprenylcysteine carboxylmethyltransferase family protein [Clostridiaceae bacterium]|nr:isoprenylcysteine carboxylmethyltransferase family protein [Clostridiaceae bacterium]